MTEVKHLPGQHDQLTHGRRLAPKMDLFSREGMSALFNMDLPGGHRSEVHSISNSVDAKGRKRIAVLGVFLDSNDEEVGSFNRVLVDRNFNNQTTDRRGGFEMAHENLHVRREGTGVGTAFVAQSFERYESQDIDKVTVHTADDGHHVWAKMGYEFHTPLGKVRVLRFANALLDAWKGEAPLERRWELRWPRKGIKWGGQRSFFEAVTEGDEALTELIEEIATHRALLMDPDSNWQPKDMLDDDGGMILLSAGWTGIKHLDDETKALTGGRVIRVEYVGVLDDDDDDEVEAKHLPGLHDQDTHGRRGVRQIVGAYQHLKPDFTKRPPLRKRMLVKRPYPHMTEEEFAERELPLFGTGIGPSYNPRHLFDKFDGDDEDRKQQFRDMFKRLEADFPFAWKQLRGVAWSTSVPDNVAGRYFRDEKRIEMNTKFFQIGNSERAAAGVAAAWERHTASRSDGGYLAPSGEGDPVVATFVHEFAHHLDQSIKDLQEPGQGSFVSRLVMEFYNDVLDEQYPDGAYPLGILDDGVAVPVEKLKFSDVGEFWKAMETQIRPQMLMSTHVSEYATAKITEAFAEIFAMSYALGDDAPDPHKRFLEKVRWLIGGNWFDPLPRQIEAGRAPEGMIPWSD